MAFKQINTKHVHYHSASNVIYANDTIPNDGVVGGFYIDIHSFTPIPKQPSIDYARSLIWEIYDHLDISKYIQKLEWDKPTTIVPRAHFLDKWQYWQYIIDIHEDILNILGKVWNIQ